MDIDCGYYANHGKITSAKSKAQAPTHTMSTEETCSVTKKPSVYSLRHHGICKGLNW